MSDRVEDELRALLQGRAASVADGRDSLAGVEAGVRRVVVRRRLAVTAGVPLLVGAVVGGVSLLSGPSSHDVDGTLAAPSSPPVLAASSPALTAPSTQPAPALSSGPAGGPATQPSSASAAVSSAPTPVDPQVEVFRAYLENAPLPRELGIVGAGFGGRPYCGLRVLDQTTKYAYLWTFCHEFYLKGSVLTAGSATYLPVRLTISGTGAATRVLGAAVPHSGRTEQAELQALFSPLAFGRSLAFTDGLLHSPGFDQSDAELRVRAMTDVRSGQLNSGDNPPAS